MIFTCGRLDFQRTTATTGPFESHGCRFAGSTVRTSPRSPPLEATVEAPGLFVELVPDCPLLQQAESKLIKITDTMVRMFLVDIQIFHCK